MNQFALVLMGILDHQRLNVDYVSTDMDGFLYLGLIMKLRSFILLIVKEIPMDFKFRVT